jgi:hypothetical protein
MTSTYYLITSFPVPEGFSDGEGFVNGISQSGELIGDLGGPADRGPAAECSAGGIDPIALPTDGNGYASAASPTGRIVGAVNVGTVGSNDPAEWIHGKLHVLGTDGFASAINGHGEVVGFSGANGGQEWFDGNTINLPFSNATGVNNDGTIVGNGFEGGPDAGAELSNGQLVDFQNLPGYATSQVGAINNAGEAVGVSGATGDGGPSQAVKWDATTGIATALPGLWGFADAVNDSGAAVGELQQSGDLALWTAKGRLVDLQSYFPSEWLGKGTLGTGIDKAGDIVGYNNVYGSFLLMHEGSAASTDYKLVTGPNLHEMSLAAK